MRHKKLHWDRVHVEATDRRHGGPGVFHPRLPGSAGGVSPDRMRQRQLNDENEEKESTFLREAEKRLKNAFTCDRCGKQVYREHARIVSKKGERFVRCGNCGKESGMPPSWLSSAGAQ